ncbi:MAG: LacI family DNA-binding transcriptional regulator [Velocimicrobium sp.]
MAVTIKDIAKHVGVAPSTVSRVINGNAAISKETKDKIIKVMKDMDYHPNSLARNFANGSTYAIGLVIDASDDNTFSNAFFNRSVYAIETVIQQNGYNLLITNDREDEKRPSVEKLVFEKKVDGIILPSSSATPKLIGVLKKNNFPFIVLGEPEIEKDETSWVDVNNALGSETAVKHLLQNGYKRIVFILENRTTVFAKNRVEGYERALSEVEGEARLDDIKDCDGKAENAFEITKKLFEQAETPDAILCSNNVIAYQVLRALRACSKSIPDEVGVMTFDNYPFSEFMDPPLSVVDVDTFRLGEQAASNLIKKIQNADYENQQTVIATKLIIRESTKGKRK